MKTGTNATSLYQECSPMPGFSSRIFKALLITFGLLIANVLCLQAATEPLISSWYTTNSGQYARVYKTTSARTGGTSSTTWTNQVLPSYSDIQAVQYSGTWVYVQYAGFASHVMGPWLNPQGGVFQFWPTNQHGIRRFPRTPVVQSGTKDTTSGGYSGLFVNGVAIFNSLDGQAWDGTQIQGQAPHTQSTYYWHRNAPVAESFNFDYALGHQPPSGIYHTHQNPLGLRYQLGDHVDYNSSSKNYSETVATATKHSPIIGWAHDGYPIYGPYGYSSASNSASGIRRMVSGYVKRDGSNGTDSVDSNRSTIPAWYARFRLAHFGGSYSTTAGASRPAVNSTYTLGTFAQDWAYLGDLGKTQGVDFDLDEYNGRLCYTPEFPTGTYAYFTTIDSSNNATYPYLLAFEFYGDAKGGSVANISESVTTQFTGGPNTSVVLNTPTVDANTRTVTLVWSSVEGGTYQVESSTNQSTWTTQTASLSSAGISTQSSYVGVEGTGYGRVTRTALASYDSATTGSFTTTQTDTESYNINSLSITTQPQSQSAALGNNATFSVVAGGVSPFSYQWRFNTVNIQNATNSSYTVTNVIAGYAGSYSVIVTNTAGSITSSNAVLTVTGDPTISVHPASQAVNQTSNVTFTVTATGSNPITYQWTSNNVNIAGATGSSFTLTGVQASYGASYRVVVTSPGGSVTSNPATLSVNVPPSITTPPQSQSVGQGGNVTFTVAANGTAPLSYQWRYNTANILNATNASYTRTNLVVGDAGNYSVVVTNIAGTATSTDAVLTVNSAPAITTQPQSQTVVVGTTVNFSVVASGTGLAYQWRSNAIAITGATTSTLSLTNVQIASAANYSVVVTNTTGSVTSSNAVLTVLSGSSSSDVVITEWLTELTGRYARIYQTSAAQTSDSPVTTWSRGAGVQSLPVYSGVQEISYSTNWVYIRSTGLGFHTMGPWYLDAQKTQLFPNYPANSHTFWRFPRTPAAASTPTLTSLGAIGYFIDGVAMFDGQDGYYWSGTAEAQGGSGGLWNRDAFPEEGVSFDPANAHQEQTGMYHYHANPLALRYLLGDHVDLNSSTKIYTESASTPTNHSPIIGWVRDGYPIYGPYGYSNPTNTSSGIRRMVTGYTLRNGQNGAVNLATTGRVTLPAWAARARSRSATLTAGEYGPGVTNVYTIGRYHEDYEYLGDLSKTQGVDFDLDEHNGRFCKTPEFPNGTYAYFMTINSSGTPVYPYNIGRVFYGNPTGGSVTNLTETVVTNWVGGANRSISMTGPTINGSDVVMTWSAVEGGTYQLEHSTDLSSWTLFDETFYEGTPDGPVSIEYLTEYGPDNSFFRVKRSALATYDTTTSSTGTGTGTGTGGVGITSISPTSGTRGTTVTLTINLDAAAQPAPPPQQAPINSVTVGTITGTSLVHVSQTQVTASITIPGNATTGAQTVTVVFPGPPDNPTATVTYTLTNGFTVQ